MLRKKMPPLLFLAQRLVAVAVLMELAAVLAVPELLLLLV